MHGEGSSWGTDWEIENSAIKNYRAIMPSTWNAGPRDAHGQRGAYSGCAP